MVYREHSPRYLTFSKYLIHGVVRISGVEIRSSSQCNPLTVKIEMIIIIGKTGKTGLAHDLCQTQF